MTLVQTTPTIRLIELTLMTAFITEFVMLRVPGIGLTQLIVMSAV